MNRDHLPIVIDSINGLYSRGQSEDSVPTDHLSTADNIIFQERGWSTRPGTSLLHTIGTVRRFHHFKRLNEVSRLIILDGVGNLYDSTDLTVPILSIPEMVDFSAAQYFNRLYITPHNRETGIENEYVYVYDGTICRRAGGTAPAGTLTVENSTVSGHVEAGTHIFAIAFETESGFITKPGPAVYGTVVADGTHKVDISGIPLGPTGTIARRVLATRRIATYNNNQEEYEFFYVPTGRIANNVDDTVTVDFYDADLSVSADFLFDQLQEIPAGVGITTYQNSLVTWGEYNDPSVVRISKQGDPESFSAVEGYLTVAPNEAGGVKNCVEFRDNLYILKSQRTYSTSRDLNNPEAALFWRVINIDEGIGTEPFGIAIVLDTSGPNTDNFIVAARSGLFLFNGMYQQPEFTWKVDYLWHQIDKERFNEVQVYNDVVLNLIYILLPDSTLLVGDYKNGLGFQSVRWSRWTFPWTITAIALDVENNQVNLVIAGDGNLWQLDSSVFNDGDTAINTVAHYAPQTSNNYGAVNQFSSVRLRCFGSGQLALTLHSLDHQLEKTLAPINLSPLPGQEILRLCNFQNEKCALHLELDSVGEHVEVLSVKMFAIPLWAERPNGTT